MSGAIRAGKGWSLGCSDEVRTLDDGFSDSEVVLAPDNIMRIHFTTLQPYGTKNC